MNKLLAKLKRRTIGSQPDHRSHPHHTGELAQKRKSSLASTAIILILAPIVAIILTTFVFQTYQVDGASMETTLTHNDRLIINKLPRTWSKITGNPFIPKRGDIIIFNKQGLNQFESSSKGRQLIKRVIGLPGERVVVKDNELIIYNDEHTKGFRPDKFYPWGRAVEPTPGNIDVTLASNEVFVCGDNRNNSQDSRIFGPIPVSDIVGRLSFRLFPLSEAKKF